MGLVGEPIIRREDVRFLTGAGNFVDDIKLAGTACIAFVRSPHAHARIRAIDTAAAKAAAALRRLSAASCCILACSYIRSVVTHHINTTQLFELVGIEKQQPNMV